MKPPTLADMVGFPWQETVRCQRCRRLYQADYRQERDWSACPDCTGEAGRPCRNVEEIRALKREQVKTKARKSFFRRLHERKRPDLAIDEEMVVFCRRLP